MEKIKNRVYWELDANKKMHFRTHLDVLEECFGIVLKMHRKGTWRLPGNEEWMVWFPHETKEVDMSQHLEWVNTISEDNTKIYERAKAGIDDYFSKATYLNTSIRLVFMEIPSVGAYVFKGAYVGEPEEMKEGNHTFTRIATRVRLVGDPVYDIELIDEERFESEKPYKFTRPSGASLGKFDSWIIKNDILAAKETDKSVFEYRESGIPKDVRWFFEVDELSMEERLDIVFEYEGVEYKSYIRREASLGRTRLCWHSDLGEKLESYYEMEDKYPILLFERDGKARYKISILKGSKKKFIEPLDDACSEEEKEEHAKTMDMDSLKEAAEKHANKQPKEKTVEIKQVIRDPYIAEYAKQRAKGVCQLCGEKAPFIDKKGWPYLESHHIIWLADGGEDSIENTVALCPNCHRKMHIVADAGDVALLTEKIRKTE